MIVSQLVSNYNTEVGISVSCLCLLCDVDKENSWHVVIVRFIFHFE